MVNSYVIGLLLSVSALIMAVFVLINNPKRSQNIVFFLIGLSSFFFTTFIFLSFIFHNDSSLTTVFNRISVAFVIFQVSCLFLFSFIFPTIRIKKQILIAALICIPAIAIAVIAVSTDFIIQIMEIKKVDDYLVMFRKQGTLYKKVYVPFFGFYLLGSLLIFIYQYKKSTTQIEKRQIRYASLATVGGGLITTITCIILPILGIQKYYAFGPPIALPFFIAVMSYNIVTLKAMDIEQLISKSIVWLTTFLVLLLPIGIFTYILMNNSQSFTLFSGTALMLLCVFIILFYLKYIQPKIDEKFQKKVHDYNKIVSLFNHQLTKLKSLDDLIDSITSIIKDAIYSSNVNVLLMTDNHMEYRIFEKNILGNTNNIILKQNQIDLIIQNEDIIEREQLKLNPDYDEEFREMAIEYLEIFDCEVVIPIIFENKLIGSINIGRRIDNYYKRIELDFIENLKTGINVAFSNSILLQQIEKLNESYARFVPKEILSHLGYDSIVEVQLGDNIQKEMTILFSDIRSFTSLSESMNPEENFKFLNSYLSRIGPIIGHQNGFIDKYIGDAVMALFPGEPLDALTAAINIVNELKTYNIHRNKQGYDPISIGIGLHTGSLMLGTIGEENRMDGTVISDAVNLASRIEGLTKIYGSKIIITEKTFELIDNKDIYNYRFLGNVQVKGKKDSIKIFEIFDGDHKETLQKKNDTKKIFETGIERYFNEDFSEASLYFKQVIDYGLDCKASKYYLNRAELYNREGLSLEMGGVECMESK